MERINKNNNNNNNSSSGYCLTEEEVAAALKEAKARGLPDGWTVKLDVSIILPNVTTNEEFFSRFLFSHDFSVVPIYCHGLVAVSKHHLSLSLSLIFDRNENDVNGLLPMARAVIPFPRRWPFPLIWDYCHEIRPFPNQHRDESNLYRQQRQKESIL
jgi:hypothetical protein